MNDIIGIIEERLNGKREEYEKLQDYFKFTATQEHGVSNYERNAIGDLSAMLQLSAEIRELEFVLSLLNINALRPRNS